ncbi:MULTISPECIES: acyloxyacyl hydrolase [unclassified Leisingera]|uniref:acyloxyacyl hydrolase n=1 Tax=unclassified Leisingera TaxID=2614906 RepID=UPI00057EE84A|nr:MULTISPECIES: acyloxyacyl hydrolase [unclassified Leisingera]KIC36864.1 lipid A 3-O-deacylase [Leisingera sp. ANG-M7]MDC0657715.1 acyloxyacyl hydrolase [Leisingera sp. SS27]NVK14829.1 acyloxyacyl hydrolase [Paracoccaceae bacterium]
MKKTTLLAAAVSAAMAAPAAAQEVTLGLGYSDYHRETAENGALFAAEYLHTPFYEKGRMSARFGGTLQVVETGDVFAGIGISGLIDLNNNWFIETSVMPGAYHESSPENDLGSAFEIRSLLAVGKRFQNGKAVSLAISHKSNASTADENPGVNSLTLRWHIPLGS